ncbi:lipopolysaccharide biosynthesis protein [Methyloversatilis sp.]|uniref:lipopolysaccharide biosynthesis protein n=1 Tax=Methyloversatilis sp. TaxID=2569862 RepID=UPI003D2877EF
MSLRRNVIANYLGQGWVAMMQLAFVPLYIRFLGIEAYGLIGVFAMLQAWMTLLDMGMTPTLGREMARFSAGLHSAPGIRDLLRTVECLCLAVVVAVILAMFGASRWLASNWFQAVALPEPAVANALALMGGVASLRLIEGLYRGALLGLQKQVFFNVFNSVVATLRAVGAVGVLAWVSPTIEAFFAWQALVSLIAAIGLALVTNRALPHAGRSAVFSRAALLDMRRFAGGMIATTLLALLLTQVDKVLLSRLLSLQDFGHYALASTVASALTLLVTPVTQAFYPRFTELAASGKTPELALLYHRGAQLVTVLCAPPALIMTCLSGPLLLAWTGDAALSSQVAPLLTLLAMGTFLNALVHIPYMLQLAHGWPGFAAWMNVIAVLLLVPAILWLVPRHGAQGAAWAWVVLNAGYVLIGLPFMYRRLLPAERRDWYVKDVAIPLLAAATVTAPFVLLLREPMSAPVTWGAMLACGGLSLLVAVSAAHRLRDGLLTVWPFTIARRTSNP